jgi:hypothetical protein
VRRRRVRAVRIGGIAEIQGNYPSKRAKGERGAWFREGNMLGIGQAVR